MIVLSLDSHLDMCSLILLVIYFLRHRSCLNSCCLILALKLRPNKNALFFTYYISRADLNRSELKHRKGSTNHLISQPIYHSCTKYLEHKQSILQLWKTLRSAKSSPRKLVECKALLSTRKPWNIRSAVRTILGNHVILFVWLNHRLVITWLHV